ncbi:hypothetical protein GCM10010195_50180 [Kitasatospora griseola]|nr:hypothetical protein GCM10010195_50180 [Kitasatospora griseola]
MPQRFRAVGHTAVGATGETPAVPGAGGGARTRPSGRSWAAATAAGSRGGPPEAGIDTGGRGPRLGRFADAFVPAPGRGGHGEGGLLRRC